MIPFKTPYNRIGLSLLDFCENGEQPDGSTYFDAIMTRALVACAAVDGSPRGRVLQVPRGDYRFARQINLDCQVVMVGEATAFGDYGSGTQFTFDAGNDGIVFHRYNTSPSGGFADGAIVCGIGLTGAAGAGVHHGVRFYARGTFMRGSIGGWDGDGVHITSATAFSASWVASSAYAPGSQVYNTGRFYVCVIGGVSAASGGPSGTSAGIVDGGVTWDYVSTGVGLQEPLDPIPNWAPLTAYRIGDAVYSDTGRTYLCVKEGVSSGATGPVGMGSHIVDGGCEWNYISGTNANNWTVQEARIGGVRHGIFTFGADSNAGRLRDVDFVACSGWGIYEASFLGNYYGQSQIADCGSGPISCTGAAGTSDFDYIYTESGQPPSDINPNSNVFGGLHGAGFVGGVQPSGVIGARFGTGSFSVGSTQDQLVLGGNWLIAFGRTGVNSLNKSAAYNGTPTGVQNTAYWNWAGLSGMTGWGQALDGNSIWQTGSEQARYMQPPQLWTALGYGVLVEGKRISFCDSTSRPGLGFGGPVTDAAGDVIFKRAPVAGFPVGWICTVGGTSSTYIEGLTATSAGGTSLTLSGNTHVTHGLQIGDRVLINGVTTYITNRGIGATTSITVANAIPAGSGLAIAYVPGTWVEFGMLDGGIDDQSGTPSATPTSTARRGKFTMAAATRLITVTNALCAATSIIQFSVDKLDATATQFRAVPLGGGFALEANNNATNALVISWELTP